jgi:dinuclear metal center YbgI/SA1388 family protein
MITCRDVARAIESFAPLSLAYSWDNCGLIAGNPEKEIKAIMTCLDADIDVVEEALRAGADLILTHHPAIFHETKVFHDQTYAGRFLKALLNSEICCYSAHTNLDCAKGGLNDFLAEKIGLSNPTGVLEAVSDTDGLGRVYDLNTPITMKELCSWVKSGLHIHNPLFYTGSPDRVIRRVALCNGGGKSFAKAAIDAGADVYLTGDVDYDRARECLSAGMNLISIEHYDSEIIVCELFERILRQAFGDDITILPSQTNVPIFYTYE